MGNARKYAKYVRDCIKEVAQKLFLSLHFMRPLIIMRMSFAQMKPYSWHFQLNTSQMVVRISVEILENRLVCFQIPGFLPLKMGIPELDGSATCLCNRYFLMGENKFGLARWFSSNYCISYLITALDKGKISNIQYEKKRESPVAFD